ncbi:MAG: hypothetical protein FWG84_03860 [Bacteroidales bacterium]|nr:hypothetical protein [Bacteroidales bacterium]
MKTDLQTGKMQIYYRLVESYRDILGNTRSRTILSVGRLDGIKAEQLWAIADGLNARYRGEAILFPEEVSHWQLYCSESVPASDGNAAEGLPHIRPH